MKTKFLVASTGLALECMLASLQLHYNGKIMLRKCGREQEKVADRSVKSKAKVVGVVWLCGGLQGKCLGFPFVPAATWTRLSSDRVPALCKLQVALNRVEETRLEHNRLLTKRCYAMLFRVAMLGC